MAMKIVLLEDVENLGRVGEVVSVRGGYGRNFLVPQGKALLATKANLALMSARRKIYEAAAAKHREAAQEIAGRITAVSPIDGEGWLETIRALARSNRPGRQTIRAGSDSYEATAGSNYFAEVSGFLETL